MSKALPNLLDGTTGDRFHHEAGRDFSKSFAKSQKRTLPVKDITVPNDYPTFDYDKLYELRPDIDANGIKERIEVQERGSRYVLLHGWVRLAAAERLGLTDIKAVVFSNEFYVPKVEPRPFGVSIRDGIADTPEFPSLLRSAAKAPRPRYGPHV